MVEYQALYRKYRPNNFDNVIGQDHIITTLKNAVELEKISHAYLFSGYRGTGKTTIAKVFAKNVNCPNSSQGLACDNCDICMEISKGISSDIMELDAASNNGVEEIRSLIDNVKYLPINCKYKVYIIDEVHMLSKSAFNALLKTLEEPPSHVIFIMATTEPQKIPITILSRVQRFDFKRINVSTIRDRLKHVLNNEKIKYDTEAIELISKLADGGMRDALSLLDKVITFDNNITLKSTKSSLGMLNSETIEKIVNIIYENNLSKINEIIEEIEKNGVDYQNVAMDLLYVFRDILILHNVGETERIQNNDEYVKKYSKLFNNSELEKIIMTISQTIQQIKYMSHGSIFLEILLYELVKEKNPKIEQQKLEIEKIKVNKEEHPLPKIEIKESIIDENPQNIVATAPGSKIQEILNTYDKQMRIDVQNKINEFKKELEKNARFGMFNFLNSSKLSVASPIGTIFVVTQKHYSTYVDSIEKIATTIENEIGNIKVIIISQTRWEEELEIFKNPKSTKTSDPLFNTLIDHFGKDKVTIGLKEN